MTSGNRRQRVVIQPEWVALAESFAALEISENKLVGFVGSAQCVERAYALASCGDVFNLSLVTVDGRFAVSGYVHAEMKASDVYACKCILDSNLLYYGHECPCIGVFFR